MLSSGLFGTLRSFQSTQAQSVSADRQCLPWHTERGFISEDSFAEAPMHDVFVPQANGSRPA